jgi:hypothetical protein
LLKFLQGCYELVAIGTAILYGLFLLHLMFPKAYHSLIETLRTWWAGLVAWLQGPSDTTRLNQMWENGPASE